MERLQKIISRAGLASRREAEKWIEEGRVTVNGVVVDRLGSRADPDRDKIKVNGKLLATPSRLYYLFHKPAGMITSMHDPEGRPHLGELLESYGRRGRVFPIGRLDFNTEGALLLTNDGELAHRLMHPRYRVPRAYHVKISGRPTEAELARLRKGIRLDNGMTGPANVRVLQALRKNAWIEIEILEGRYREVRRMIEAVGYFVEKLIRVRFGPIQLAALRPGEIRPLSPREIGALKRAVGLKG